MNFQDILAKIKQYPIAFGGGIVALVFLGLLQFTSGTIGELETSYQELEDQLKVIQQNQLDSVGLEEDLTNAQKMVEDINSRLMKDDAKADHYQYFLGIAERSKSTISDPIYGGLLNPGAKGVTIETKEFAQIEYALRLEGEFKSVLNFMYGLRTGKYFIRETRLLLQPADQKDREGGIVSAEINVKVLAKKTVEEKKDG